MNQSYLSTLEGEDISNIYIFIADSVRYDAAPRAIIEDGLFYKTVSHALMTAQSVPTMLSGLYPTRHGVKWFDYKLDNSFPTVFDLEDDEFSVGMNQLRWGADEFATGLPNVFDNPDGLDLAEVEEPFVCIDHDMGGHAPFPHLDGEPLEETFKRNSMNHSGIRSEYDRAVEDSTNMFESRLSILSDRGLLDDTLIVYTSDHGELLGEYGGFCSHLTPNAPENVYVPTVFLHPSLDPASPRELPLFHHVDLIPTLCDILGIEWGRSVDGRSLLNGVEYDEPAPVHAFMHSPGEYRDGPLDPAYVAPGVWTRNGGIVFNESPLWKRALMSGYDAFMSRYTGNFLSSKNMVKKLAITSSMYLPNCKVFGSPSVSKDEAREIISTDELGDVASSERTELSASQRDRLKDLGYV